MEGQGGGSGEAMEREGGGRGGAMEGPGGCRGGTVDKEGGVQPRGPKTGSNVPVVRGAVGRGPVEGGVACGGGQGGGGGRAVIVGSVNMTNNVDDRVTDVSDYVSAKNKYSNQKKG